MWYSKEYNPIQVGSIDGTDIDPHDAAIARAARSTYRPPKHLKTDPDCTLFVSRLNFDTSETALRPFFEKYGSISNIDLVRNNVTGLSQGYAFITFADTKACRDAYKHAHEETLDDHIILVDYERSRVMNNWIPRRLGGGYGGKKESGQLRFGARDRPFRDTHGKLKIDYDQKQSDNWTHKRSSECTTRDHYHDRSGRDGVTDRHRDRSTKRSGDKSSERRRYRANKHDGDRPTERHRDRSTERHRNRSTERHRDRSTDRHRDRSSHKRSAEQIHSDRRSPDRKKKRMDTQNRHR